MSEYGSSANITGSLIVDGETELGSGDDDILMDGDDNTLVVDGTNNRVGILTDSPAYALEVAGDMGVNEYIYHNGDTNTFIRFETDEINIKAGNVNFINITEATQDKITFNDGGGDVDFIVQSPNESKAIYINAGNEVLHINHGESNFQTKIHNTNDTVMTIDSTGVIFNEDSHASIDFRIESDGEDEAIFLNAGSNQLYINKGATAFTTVIKNNNEEVIRVGANGLIINEYGHASNDVRVESDNDTHMLFVDAGNDRIGVGTSSPDGLLHISTATTDATLIIEADTDNNNEGDNPIIILRQDGGLVDSAIYHATSPSNNDLHIASAVNMIFATSTNGRYASATAKMAITDTGEVGIGTTDPDGDAILELSSSDQGFMLPRVLSSAKPSAASALNGLMIYEEDTHRLKIVANGAWETISFED